ncbi:MAG: oligosaccharide flippase family protein [Porphyromonas sp.]|nr:oligosaccharide flippase family protein [Porphyromonas sp.]
MAGRIKGLMKDTAIYGIANMLGRFLNWALFPLYINRLPSPKDYGIVTNLYAWTALALILLTYGMETGFFRFINKGPNPHKVYANTLRCLGFTSSVFVILGLLFLHPIASQMGYGATPELVGMLMVIVAIDAFSSIPFAYLRHTNRPIRFAAIKLGYILLAVGLNLFFLILCPWLIKGSLASTISWFYQPDYGVGYIFVSNLIANIILLLVLIPDMRPAKGPFDFSLIRNMLRYSLPFVLLGIAGSFNQMADKILFPYIFDDMDYANHQLGIYSAGFKIAIVIVMFTQAFRFAYEPFIFKKKKGEDAQDRKVYAEVMHYYIIVSLLIYVGVLAYLDLIKVIITIPPAYIEGLKVVPLVMVGEIFFGIYYNLSIWYKLTDRAIWGALLSTLGCAFTLLFILLGAPRYGFMACAWACVVSYGVMMIASYLLGQKYYPIPYRLRPALLYLLVAVGLTTLIEITQTYVVSIWGRLFINSLIMGLFILVILVKEPALKQISYFRKSPLK